MEVQVAVNQILPYTRYNNAFQVFCYGAFCSFAARNLSKCPAVIRNIVLGFYTRLQNLSNKIIQVILQSEMWRESRLALHWMRSRDVHLARQKYCSLHMLAKLRRCRLQNYTHVTVWTSHMYYTMVTIIRCYCFCARLFG